MQVLPQPVLERVPRSGAASLAVRDFRLPAFRHPWHQHPEVELTWILKGRGLRHVGDSVEPFQEGDCCLLGANLPHTWLSRTRGGVRSLVVQFDPAIWGSEWQRLPEFAAIRSLLDRAARGLRFESSAASRLRGRLEENTGRPLRQFTAVLEVLDELARVKRVRPLSLTPWGSRTRPPCDPRLGQVLAYLTRQTGGPVSQAEAAALARLTPAAFSRFFRREVGKTFRAYVTDIRLGEVCRQLLETNRTISEVAFGAGFGNLSNFNRAFRAARGVPPSEFRRRARGDIGPAV